MSRNRKKDKNKRAADGTPASPRPAADMDKPPRPIPQPSGGGRQDVFWPRALYLVTIGRDVARHFLEHHLKIALAGLVAMVLTIVGRVVAGEKGTFFVAAIRSHFTAAEHAKVDRDLQFMLQSFQPL